MLDITVPAQVYRCLYSVYLYLVRLRAPVQWVLVTTLGYGCGPLPAVGVERFVERRAG